MYLALLLSPDNKRTALKQFGGENLPSLNRHNARRHTRSTVLPYGTSIFISLLWLSVSMVLLPSCFPHFLSSWIVDAFLWLELRSASSWIMTSGDANASSSDSPFPPYILQYLCICLSLPRLHFRGAMSGFIRSKCTPQGNHPWLVGRNVATLIPLPPAPSRPIPGGKQNKHDNGCRHI